MGHIRYHRLASQEAVAAVEWYEDKRPGLGAELRTELLRAERAILEGPFTWPVWPGTDPAAGIRRYLLPRFPYALAYLVEETPIIIAVAHARRRPLYWLARHDG